METEKINSSKNLGRVFVLVVSLIVIGVSGSYAYFVTNIVGTPTTTTATTGKFEVTSSLEGANAINASGLGLINASEVAAKAKSLSFNVVSTSNSTINAKYDIYLKSVSLSKNLYSDYFKWELIDSDCTEENCTVANGNFSTVERNGNPVDGEDDKVLTTVKDIKLTSNSILLNKNTTQNLIFRIWLENDPNVNQIGLTSGNFQGKLSITAIPSEIK